MHIFGMGMPELVIILAVVLIIFGPKNLPKLGQAIGRGVKSMREGVQGVTNELQGDVVEADNEDDEVVEAEEAPAPKKKQATKTTTKATKKK